MGWDGMGTANVSGHQSPVFASPARHRLRFERPAASSPPPTPGRCGSESPGERRGTRPLPPPQCRPPVVRQLRKAERGARRNQSSRIMRSKGTSPPPLQQRANIRWETHGCRYVMVHATRRRKKIYAWTQPNKPSCHAGYIRAIEAEIRPVD